MSTTKRFTNATGEPVADNTNIMTAGPRGPALLQDIWLLEKLAHFDREVIPERRMHAKGWGAHGTFTVTKDTTRFTKAKIFSAIGKQTPMFVRFSTVAGERGAADAERDVRGRRFPALDALHPGNDGSAGEDPSPQSLRSYQGLAKGRVSIDRGRRHGAQPLSGELFRQS
jgi:hypothetical protein